MRRRGFGSWAIVLAVWVLMAAPIVIIIVNSFNASAVSSFPPVEWSTRWYEQALTDTSFRDGFLRSVHIAVISALISVVAGLCAAYAFARRRFIGSAALLALINTPLNTPKIAIGLAGLVAYVSMTPMLGAAAQLLDGTVVLALLHAAMSLPLVLGVTISAMEGVDRELEYAARDLGRGPVGAFLSTVLPSIAPALLVATVFSFMVSFDELESSLFMATVAGNTLPVQMFLYLETNLDPTLAALSSLLLGFTFVIVALAAVLGGRRVVTKGWR